MKRKKPVSRKVNRKRRVPAAPLPVPQEMLCEICRDKVLVTNGNVPIHDTCRQCPQCKESFTFIYLRALEGAYLRCLHCLHLWNGKPVVIPTES